MPYVVLGLATASGVAGTVLTRASDGFSRRGPGVAAVGAFALATVCLSYLLTQLPVGLVYAVWTGCAAVVLLVIDRAVFGVTLRAVQVVGVLATLVGVVLLVRAS